MRRTALTCSYVGCVGFKALSLHACARARPYIRVRVRARGVYVNAGCVGLSAQPRAPVGRKAFNPSQPYTLPPFPQVNTGGAS